MAIKLKIFGLYSTEGIEVKDQGLKQYINLDEKLVLRTLGRNKTRFRQAKVNVIERLANLLGVPGHRGKKQKIMTNHSSGKYEKHMKIILATFKIIEEKTKQNPIQVLVRAIENAAPRDEITVIEYGGARYPQAVDVSPMRRVNLALRNMVHGSYDKSFNKKNRIEECLAAEIMFAADNNMDSFAMTKKNEAEKQADSAR
jgi:small subunit ribosomal protein S7